MCAGLGMRLIMKVRMDNRCTVDNMAVIKETDIRIVECEDHD